MRKPLTLLALCVAIVACDTRTGSSVTAPFSAELGRYALQSVNGSPIPYLVTSSIPNATSQLVADTLTFASGGDVREIYYVKTTPATGASTTSSFSMGGKYTITRDSIHLPPDFSYLYGRYAAGQVTLTSKAGSLYLFIRK